MISVLNSPSLYSSLFSVVDFCKQNAGEEINIIVPDKLSLFMEKFLFEQLKISASFDIKINTLNRFAKRNCDVSIDKQITKTGSLLLVQRILNENIEKFKTFKSKTYSFSYAENIFNTISQLKASKINPNEMENFVSENLELNDKIHDLALVYNAYEDLKAGLLDSSDVFLMSAFSVSNGLNNAKILFVGFDDFTAVEYTIIERLSESNNVYVISQKSNGSNKYIFNNEMEMQLKNIAYVNNFPFKVENFGEYGTELKKFLQNNLFGVSDAKFLQHKENLTVYSAKNVQDEIEFVARDIRTKILKGYKFDNFGVAIFDLQSHNSKIKEIFEKYEINYYIDEKPTLNRSVLFKFLCSVFKFNLEGYELIHLIDIINSPFFSLDENEKEILIDKLQAVNYRGKISDKCEFDISKELKQKLIDFVSMFQFDKVQNVFDIVNEIKFAIDKFNFQNVMETIAENIDMQNRILLLNSYDTTLNLFDEILKFNPNIDLSEFYNIFLRVSNLVGINNLPLTIDAVKVVDADDNMEIFKEYYLVNCVSQFAPNLKFDCGIILDNEINKLNFSNKLNPTIAHINKLAKLRLFNTSLLFENDLCLTYTQSSSELVKEFRNKLNANLICSQNEDVDCLALSKWDYIENICKIKNLKTNEIISKKLKINENLIKNKKIINISNKNLNIFKELKSISASSLENYFKCPMLLFLSNILKIKPRIKNEIQSFDIGNILHNLLFTYYKRKKQVGDIYEFCKSEILKYAERDDHLRLNAKSPILANLIFEAMRVLNGVNHIDENSQFVPTLFEHEFSNSNSSALKLGDIDLVGKIDRIDFCRDLIRVIDYKSGKEDANLKDLYYGNKLQLFLYANAVEKEFNKKVVGNFYLPLHNAYTTDIENGYSLNGFFLDEDFVLRSLDKRLAPGGKSDILNVTMDKTNKVIKRNNHKVMNDGELTNLKNYSMRVSSQAVEEIKSGFIAPTPSDVKKPCDYCPYVQICLKKSNAINYREANKVDLSSFKEDGNG